MDLKMFAEYQAAKAEGDAKKIKKLRDRLISDNMGLVKQQVTKLHRRSTAFSEVEDLMQAGALGMCTALERYNPESGAFSTYASHWIRHEVQQCIGKQAPIRRPKTSGVPYKVLKKGEEILQRTGRPATPEELEVRQEDLDKWARFPVIVKSFDEPVSENKDGIGEHCGMSLHEVVADSRPGPQQLLEANVTAASLTRALATLKDRELRVITLMFVDGQSYKEIAATLGVSEEYIRQVRTMAVDKLRAVVVLEDDE